MSGTEFDFDPQDVMDYVTSDAQVGLSDLRQDLISLVSKLNECQKNFHGKSATGESDGIYRIYENFATIIGSVDGYRVSGAWGTAFQVRNLLNSSYTVAKNYQIIQQQDTAADNFFRSF